MALSLFARKSTGHLSTSAAAAVTVRSGAKAPPYPRNSFCFDQISRLQVLSPACSIKNPQWQVAASRQAHKACSMTSPASPVSWKAGQPSLQPMQQYDQLAESISATAAAAKQALQMMGRAVPELCYTIDSYAATLKQEACSRLKVSPGIMDRPDTQKLKQRLAHRCMMALSLDNCQPTLDWMALHPALGVPLLRAMISTGHADAFGLPVFVEQPKRHFDLDIGGYHALMQQRPHFVGRCLEKYWDDGVTVEPHPFPVIAASELAEEVLTTCVIESVLGGFAAGRRLLALGKGTGLSTGGCDFTSSSAAVSWWDLAWSNPCAVLGMLLLSKPLTPLTAFLSGAERCNTLISLWPATSSSSAQDHAQVEDGTVVTCDEDAGSGKGCCYGSLTAVGAGGGGEGVQVHLLLPTERPQESEAACLHAEHLPPGLSLSNPMCFKSTVFM